MGHSKYVTFALTETDILDRHEYTEEEIANATFNFTLYSMK